MQNWDWAVEKWTENIYHKVALPPLDDVSSDLFFEGGNPWVLSPNNFFVEVWLFKTEAIEYYHKLSEVERPYEALKSDIELSKAKLKGLKAFFELCIKQEEIDSLPDKIVYLSEDSDSESEWDKNVNLYIIYENGREEPRTEKVYKTLNFLINFWIIGEDDKDIDEIIIKVKASNNVLDKELKDLETKQKSEKAKVEDFRNREFDSLRKKYNELFSFFNSFTVFKDIGLGFFLRSNDKMLSFLSKQGEDGLGENKNSEDGINEDANRNTLKMIWDVLRWIDQDVDEDYEIKKIILTFLAKLFSWNKFFIENGLITYVTKEELDYVSDKITSIRSEEILEQQFIWNQILSGIKEKHPDKYNLLFRIFLKDLSDRFPLLNFEILEKNDVYYISADNPSEVKSEDLNNITEYIGSLISRLNLPELNASKALRVNRFKNISNEKIEELYELVFDFDKVEISTSKLLPKLYEVVLNGEFLENINQNSFLSTIRDAFENDIAFFLKMYLSDSNLIDVEFNSISKSFINFYINRNWTLIVEYVSTILYMEKKESSVVRFLDAVYPWKGFSRSSMRFDKTVYHPEASEIDHLRSVLKTVAIERIWPLSSFFLRLQEFESRYGDKFDYYLDYVVDLLRQKNPLSVYEIRNFRGSKMIYVVDPWILNNAELENVALDIDRALETLRNNRSEDRRYAWYKPEDIENLLSNFAKWSYFEWLLWMYYSDVKNFGFSNSSKKEIYTRLLWKIESDIDFTLKCFWYEVDFSILEWISWFLLRELLPHFYQYNSLLLSREKGENEALRFLDDVDYSEKSVVPSIYNTTLLRRWGVSEFELKRVESILTSLYYWWITDTKGLVKNTNVKIISKLLNEMYPWFIFNSDNGEITAEKKEFSDSDLKIIDSIEPKLRNLRRDYRFLGVDEEFFWPKLDIFINYIISELGDRYPGYIFVFDELSNSIKCLNYSTIMPNIVNKEAVANELYDMPFRRSNEPKKSDSLNRGWDKFENKSLFNTKKLFFTANPEVINYVYWWTISWIRHLWETISWVNNKTEDYYRNKIRSTIIFYFRQYTESLFIKHNIEGLGNIQLPEKGGVNFKFTREKFADYVLREEWDNFIRFFSISLMRHLKVDSELFSILNSRSWNLIPILDENLEKIRGFYEVIPNDENIFTSIWNYKNSWSFRAYLDLTQGVSSSSIEEYIPEAFPELIDELAYSIRRFLSENVL